MNGWLGIVVAAGGAVGAMARYGMNTIIARRFQTGFPYGTLAVNVAGSFILGWLLGSDIDEDWFYLLGVGFCGAFTTFSTFAYENMTMLRKRSYRVWLIYLGVTFAGAIGAAALGFGFAA